MEPLGALDPRRLGDWEIVGRLGHGGMGVVYLARRTVAGRVREAAVKTISPQLRSEPESLARFRREVAVLMGLEIPGAVGVLSADLDGDPFWYATQYIEGPDLQAYVRSRGPMPPDLHRALSWSLLDTLARIHQRGITHRDLKPGNVLLGPDGPLIIDFGIAFVRGAMTLTQGMWGPGTPAWSSPEQLRGDPVGPPSDTFSLAAVLAFTATGRHPFDPESSLGMAITEEIRHGEPDLSGMAPDVESIVRRMLAKDPAMRPSAEAARQAVLSGVDEAGRAAVAAEAGAQGWQRVAAAWAGAGVGDPAEEALLALTDPGSGAGREAVPDVPGQPPVPPPGATAPPGAVPTPAPPVGGPSGDPVPEVDRIDPAPRDVSAHPPEVGGPRRRTWLAVVGLLAVVLLGSLSIWMGGRGGSSADVAEDPVAGGATSSLPSAEFSSVPVLVDLGALPRGSTPDRIAVGDTSACLIAQGKAYCWGSNDAGQLGSVGGGSDVPRAVDDSGVLRGADLVRIAVGAGHACALDARGRAYCWGANDEGQLGIGEPSAGGTEPRAVLSPRGDPWADELELIGAGGSTTCTQTKKGRMYCWGRNDDGQLGDGTRSASALPRPIDTSGAIGSTPILRFATGRRHVCAVDTSRVAYCWGANDEAQLGNGRRDPSTVPVAVTSTDVLPKGSVQSITVSLESTCARSTQGAAACWGGNSRGQLGDGLTTGSAVPIAVDVSDVGSSVFRVDSGGRASCAIAEESSLRSVVCWGANDRGQLGDASTTDASSPVRVSDGTGMRQPSLVRVGRVTTCALTDSGGVWCWGSNESGLLGAGPDWATRTAPPEESATAPATPASSATASPGATGSSQRAPALPRATAGTRIPSTVRPTTSASAPPAESDLPPPPEQPTDPADEPTVVGDGAVGDDVPEGDGAQAP